ncbi:PEP-CTERM sorting domain-containing protein [Phenylobacterium sp.]|uniref:PEP-CTERM sorting domain-containing protein n=1 Tax=Phenylobacterium sp. TaxID=1871053 RepID=UPI00374CA0BC
MDDGGPGHLTNPTNVNGFEAAKQSRFAAGVPYTEGGITVVGQGNGIAPNDAATDFVFLNGERGWYESGTTFEKISLSNHGVIDEVQWKAYVGYPRIDYELWFEGHLVDANHFGGGGSVWRNYGIEANGTAFDEVWLTAGADDNQVPFGLGTFNAMALDDIAIRSSNPPSLAAAVPEAGTWVMMFGGFGGVGAALRRRRSLAGSLTLAAIP